MNLAKMIKTLQTEMFKKRTDNELESYLKTIMWHLQADIEDDSLCLDPYGKDYIYDDGVNVMKNDWDNDLLSYNQRKEAQKQAENNLKRVSNKLKRFGFNCIVHVNKTSKTEDSIIFYNPLLIIKL